MAETRVRPTETLNEVPAAPIAVTFLCQTKSLKVSSIIGGRHRHTFACLGQHRGHMILRHSWLFMVATGEISGAAVLLNIEEVPA